MVVTSFKQTDGITACGAVQACSSSTTATVPQARQAVYGGSAGSTPLSVTINRNTSGSRSGVMFEGNPQVPNWASGNWTVRLNVTTANANLTWTEVYICRRSSACGAVSTIGSATGLGISLSSTGVKSTVVSGSSDNGTTTDKFYIVLVFTNSAGTAQIFAFTPNQDIDTPIDLTVTSTGSGSFSGASGAGSGSPVADGTGSGSFSGASGSGSGTSTVTGTGNGVFNGAQSSGSGSPTVIGSGTGSLGELSGAGSGSPVADGTGSGSFSGSSGTGSGSPVADGTGSSSFGGLGGTGSVMTSIFGSGSGVFGGFDGTGEGESVTPKIRTTKAKGEALANFVWKRRITKIKGQVLASVFIPRNLRKTKLRGEVLSTYTDLFRYLRKTKARVEVLALKPNSIVPRRVTKVRSEVLARYESATIVPIPIPDSMYDLVNANWSGGGGSLETAWKTDITKSQTSLTSESRSLLTRPIRVMRIQLTGIDQDRATKIINLCANIADQRLPFPIFFDKSVVLEESSGDTIHCDTTTRRFFVGGRVLIHKWEKANIPGAYEIATILSIQQDSLTVSTLADTYPVRSRVYPLMDCEISLSVPNHAITDEVIDIDFEVAEIVGPSALPPVAFHSPEGAQWYRGFPIFQISQNWVEGFDSEIIREGKQETLGRGTEVDITGDRPLFQHTLSLLALDRDTFWKILKFFDSRKGSAKPFFVVNPMTLYEYVEHSGKTLTVIGSTDVDNIRFFDYVGIEVYPGRYIIREIVSVTQDGPNWVITLNESIGNTSIRRVTSAHFVQMSSDALQEEWITDEKMSTSLTMIDSPNYGEVAVSNLSSYIETQTYGPGAISGLYLWLHPSKNVWYGSGDPPTQRIGPSKIGDTKRVDFWDDVRILPNVFSDFLPVPRPGALRLQSTLSSLGPSLVNIENYQLFKGQTVLEFHGSPKNKMYLDDYGQPFWTKSGLTIFVVAILRSSGSFVFFHRPDVFKWTHTKVTPYQSFGVLVTSKELDTDDLRDGKLHIFALRWNPGKRLEVYRDGNLKGEKSNENQIVTSLAEDEPTATYLFDVDTTNSEPKKDPGKKNAFLAEYLIYNRFLAKSDFNAVGNYLAKKFGPNWKDV